jgi:hypothetical protein
MLWLLERQVNEAKPKEELEEIKKEVRIKEEIILDLELTIKEMELGLKLEKKRKKKEEEEEKKKEKEIEEIRKDIFELEISLQTLQLQMIEKKTIIEEGKREDQELVNRLNLE